MTTLAASVPHTILPSARAVVRWLLILLAALLAVAGIERWVFTGPSADAERAAARPPYAPADYAAALRSADEDVRLGRERVATDPASWARQESLAVALQSRAQLTGLHSDRREAVRVIELARKQAPEGSGPVVARTVIAMGVHQNAVAARELERLDRFAIRPDKSLRAEAQAIRGDIALYRGDYAEALRLYRAARALSPSSGTLLRLAEWHRHMGDFGEARALLAKALARRGEVTPRLRATLLLQLGAIDLQLGEWNAAEARFRAADRAFPGWWLAQVHVAQMEAARGDFAAAERRYRAVLSDERPDVIAALAALHRFRGEASEAERLQRRADALLSSWTTDLPEAYADHAADSALLLDEAARAHRLAALNYRARPYGDARIGLARAAEALGRLASARAVLDELDRSGWRSAEQYRVLSDVCERLGDAACARSARGKALAISPRAFDPRAKLLAFGHH